MPRGHLQLTRRPEGGTIDLEVLKRKSWPGIAAQFMRIAAPATFDFKISGSSNFIVLQDLYRIEGETCASGLPRTDTRNLRNKLTYLPSGCDLQGWSKIDKVGALGTVTIEQSVCSKQSIDLANIPPRVEFEDQMLRSVLLRLQAILDNPSLDIPGYAETLGELLAFELGRAACGRQLQLAKPRGLSAGQVRMVTEYMDSHLTEKTTISELAAVIDLTRFHFIRSFKQTVGIPPHQFMIGLRVDRAKELLAVREHSIAEVAAMTGFGSVIQLTRSFRRVVGTTPSAYRRENC